VAEAPEHRRLRGLRGGRDRGVERRLELLLVRVRVRVRARVRVRVRVRVR